MGFTVIIPSSNHDNLKVCTAAIQRQEPTPVQAVVTNGMRIPDGVRGISDPIPSFCFARAVNLGIVNGLSDVILMNDDAVLVSGHIKWLVEAANEIQGIVSASVRGLVNNPEQLEYTPPYPHFPRENKARLLQKGYLAFVCVAIPRSVINRIGLLDERFTEYGGEDVDYCHRARLEGIPLAVHCAVVVDHGNILKSTYRRNGCPSIEPGLRILREKWERIRNTPLPL